MSALKLTPKAQNSYERLHGELSRRDILWAFGPPISTVYWNSYIGDFPRIIMPRNTERLEISGFVIEKLEPSAFEKLSYVGGNNDFPVISAEDTIIYFLEHSDNLTPYHITKVNKIDTDYFARRVDEEAKNSDLTMGRTLQGQAWKALHTFPEFERYAQKWKEKLTADEIKNLASDPSWTKENMEFSMWKNYEPGPIRSDIWEIVNRTLERAESNYAMKRIEKKAVDVLNGKTIFKDRYSDFPEDIEKRVGVRNVYNFFIKDNEKLVGVTYDPKKTKIQSVKKHSERLNINAVYMQHDLDVDRLVESFERLAKSALETEGNGIVFSNTDASSA